MAVDADVLSQLVYTISGVDSLLFEINSQSGKESSHLKDL